MTHIMRNPAAALPRRAGSDGHRREAGCRQTYDSSGRRASVARWPNFEAIHRAALAVLPVLLNRWCPGGRVQGREWAGLNPTRNDGRPGSFRVNLCTGRWADFATGDRGGDVVSLAAYLHGLNQAEAARRLAAMFGI